MSPLSQLASDEVSKATDLGFGATFEFPAHDRDRGHVARQVPRTGQPDQQARIFFSSQRDGSLFAVRFKLVHEIAKDSFSRPR